MAALTLVEAAKIAETNGEAKKAGVIALFAEKSDILAAVPFMDIAGNALTFTQEGSLPTTAFRAVNEAYTANTGTFAPQTESLYMAGGDLDVDVFILKTQGEGVRGKHEAIKVKALAVGVTTQIMSGDTTTDARGFDGLQKRITGGQLFAAGATSGGDALSLAILDQAIDAVNEPSHIILSRAMRLKFQSAYRTSTFPNIYMTVDESGKQIWSYAGIPLLVGYPSNSNTKILPFTEANPGGGSAVGTSIYVVAMGEDGVCGIQNGGMDVRDLGELQTAPVKRTRVEWYPGLTIQSPYAASRLWGIKSAAIVA